MIANASILEQVYSRNIIMTGKIGGIIIIKNSPHMIEYSCLNLVQIMIFLMKNKKYIHVSTELAGL